MAALDIPLGEQLVVGSQRDVPRHARCRRQRPGRREPGPGGQPAIEDRAPELRRQLLVQWRCGGTVNLDREIKLACQRVAPFDSNRVALYIEPLQDMLKTDQ